MPSLIVEADASAELETYFRWPSREDIETPVEIFFPQRILEEAYRHAQRGLPLEEGGQQAGVRREVKGALLGKAIKSHPGDRVQVWIHACVPLPILEQDTATRCVYRAEDKIYIDLLCEQKYGGFHEVGWFHSHPDWGIFLSSTDQATMTEAFPLAHHVALVLDPIQKTGGFFVWEGEMLDHVAPRERFSLVDFEVGEPDETFQPNPPSEDDAKESTS